MYPPDGPRYRDFFSDSRYMSASPIAAKWVVSVKRIQYWEYEVTLALGTGLVANVVIEDHPEQGIRTFEVTWPGHPKPADAPFDLDAICSFVVEEAYLFRDDETADSVDSFLRKRSAS